MLIVSDLEHTAQLIEDRDAFIVRLRCAFCFEYQLTCGPIVSQIRLHLDFPNLGRTPRLGVAIAGPACKCLF